MTNHSQVEELSESDKLFLDSCLNVFHHTEHDTAKIKILGTICNELPHSVWKDYLFIQLYMLRKQVKLSPYDDMSTQLKVHIANALNKVGFHYYYQNKLDEGLDFINKCLGINKAINNGPGIADCLQNLGVIHFILKDYSKSLQYHRESLSINDRLDRKLKVQVNLNDIGSSLIRLNKYKMAQAHFKQALKSSEKIGFNNKAIYLYNIGSTHYYLDEFNPALQYYKASLKISKKHNTNKYYAICLIGTATLYLKKNKLDSAFIYTNESMETAYKIKDQNILRFSSFQMSEIYERMGKTDEALKMYKLYTQLHDSIKDYSADLRLSKQMLQEKLLLSKHEVNALSREKKYRAKRIRFYAVISICIILILILFSIILINRKKRLFSEQLNELRALLLKEQRANQKAEGIKVRYGKTIKSIDLDDILFFNSKQKYVFLTTHEEKSYIVDYSLSSLENELPSYFRRVHRSYIINGNKIVKITKKNRGMATFELKGKNRYEISSGIKHTNTVKTIINNYKESQIS